MFLKKDERKTKESRRLNLIRTMGNREIWEINIGNCNIKRKGYNVKKENMIYELRVTSSVYELRIQVYELRVQIHELRVQIYTLRVQRDKSRI